MTLLKAFSRKPEFQSSSVYILHVQWLWTFWDNWLLLLQFWNYFREKDPSKISRWKLGWERKQHYLCLLQSVFTNIFSFQQNFGSVRSNLDLDSLHFILISFTKMPGEKKAAFLKNKGHFEISVIAWNTNSFCQVKGLFQANM